MPAGTIALTNNSTTVGGTGTAFTSELKAGDFIGVTVGGAPYTMIVASIASNTQLTIAQAYNGPTASGLAWYGVPATLKYAITQQVLNDMATNQRGMIAQLANWQKIYSDAPSVTVERSDRSTFTGPSWGYMSNQFANKADLVSGAVAISQGGTGQKTAQAAWNALAQYGSSSTTAARGDDARLNTVGGKSGGAITSAITVAGSAIASSTAGLAVEAGERNRVEINNTANGGNTGNPVGWTVYRWYNELTQTGIRRAGDTSIQSYFIAMTGAGSWEFQKSGSATAPGSWVNGSDERHKTKITAVPDALASVLSWRGATYVKKDGAAEVGLIAQDVEKACPVAVSTNGDRTFQDGTVIPEFKYLNTSGAAAAFHTEAIKALFSIVEMLALDNPEVLAVVDKIKASAEEIGKREVVSEATWKDEPPVLDVPSNEESQSGS
ncbi:tail fiber domain-containing protein [uncultured Erwinia sp.]|uniref:tail fiber domain-containing protein n=1 Tax=uncultured Erwinia sp. TaxID=246798 RepID=UPI00258B1BCD|nr:tail fiber domain-containing protein [uncultured Erwinia sp.]